MTAALDDPAVVDYLATLDRLLHGNPDRALVLDGIRQHIDDALTGAPITPARIRDVLDELGDPASIAAEAPEQTVKPSAPFLDRRGGAVLTVVLITVGGVVVPVVGWLVGLVLLWLSHGWTALDKAIGTFGPIILAGALFAVSFALPDGASLQHLALIAGLAIGVGLAAVYLLTRFRQPS